MNKVVVSIIMVSGLISNLHAQDEKVIYGVDNRQDIYKYQDQRIVVLSKSTVALVRNYKLSPLGNLLSLSTTIFRETNDLCSQERFGSQPKSAFCSGFLIAPNKIVTAGHCIENDSECAETKFVFDFKMLDSENAQLNFDQNSVYSCKTVLGQDQISHGVDYAVIELDRDVVGRTPLKLADNTLITTGSPLLVIGHPSGLPLKITDGAKIRKIETEAGFLVANLDTYGGNSGSAVFNAQTLEVEGILVRGEKDFIDDEANNCTVSNVIGDDEGRGEDVSLISRIRENGFATTVTTEPVPSTELRYVYLPSDNTCNEFHGPNYIREVEMSLCN